MRNRLAQLGLWLLMLLAGTGIVLIVVFGLPLRWFGRGRWTEDLLHHLDDAAQRAQQRAAELAGERRRAHQQTLVEAARAEQQRRKAEAARAAELLASDEERGRVLDELLGGDDR